MTDSRRRSGKSFTSPTTNTQRAIVPVKVPKTENIIFIGSELSYNSFWLKNMFIAAAYPFVRDGNKFRKSDKVTIAYVDYGYTRLEKLGIEGLKNEISFTDDISFVSIKTKSTLIAILNANRDSYKIQDMGFFCHGLNGKITLNYSGRIQINLEVNDIEKIFPNSFLNTSNIRSYACRTGMSNSSLLLARNEFDNLNQADPTNSFAQLFANKHQVKFYAFYTRTLYSNVLNLKEDAKDIANALKEQRSSKQNIIEILSEYQALRHSGLGIGAQNLWGILPRGAVSEGTTDYSLWRKEGGLRLPVAAHTPTGLPTNMATFSPTN